MSAYRQINPHIIVEYNEDCQSWAYANGLVTPNHPMPATLYDGWLAKIYDCPKAMAKSEYFSFVVSHLSMYC